MMNNDLGSWKKVLDTPSVNSAYFYQYQNLQTGLVTRVALNLRPFVVPTHVGDLSERKFYFCVGCKEQDQDRLKDIFQKYNPEQKFAICSLNFEKESGFLLWISLNPQASLILGEVFQTICDSKKLQGEVPESISVEFQDKVRQSLLS